MGKETTKKERDFLDITYKDRNGYLRFRNNDKLVHRRVAKKMYFKNKDKYPHHWNNYQVHHIDGDKLNNRIENLEIVTRKEHRSLHGIKTENWFRNNFFLIIILILLLFAGAIILFSNINGKDKQIDGVVICSKDFYDCSDFSSCQEAVNVLNTCGSRDIHYLDRNKNGIPCENLCS